ncbi:MAG: hypothetical protein QM765_11780 [Myxococcales bacterium]
MTLERDQANLLHGAGAAVRSWSEAGADLILGGHIHLPYVLALHELAPGLARRVWAVQAGTALSTRVRHEAPNSVQPDPFRGPGPGALHRRALGLGGCGVQLHRRCRAMS